ncbi:hypothetical protein ABIA32_002701 [Streptacidiphilus sp. MAP12-20]
MNTSTGSAELSPPEPPGPTGPEPEPPIDGPARAPDGALTAAGAWPLIRKTIF